MENTRELNYKAIARLKKKAEKGKLKRRRVRAILIARKGVDKLKALFKQKLEEYKAKKVSEDTVNEELNNVEQEVTQEVESNVNRKINNSEKVYEKYRSLRDKTRGLPVDLNKDEFIKFYYLAIFKTNREYEEWKSELKNIEKNYPEFNERYNIELQERIGNNNVEQPVQNNSQQGPEQPNNATPQEKDEENLSEEEKQQIAERVNDIKEEKATQNNQPEQTIQVPEAQQTVSEQTVPQEQLVQTEENVEPDTPQTVQEEVKGNPIVIDSKRYASGEEFEQAHIEEQKEKEIKNEKLSELKDQIEIISMVHEKMKTDLDKACENMLNEVLKEIEALKNGGKHFSDEPVEYTNEEGRHFGK